MMFYKDLFELSKALQEEEDYENIAVLLLDRIVKITNSAKGFIVVREDGKFKDKYQIRFESSTVSKRKHNFSRSLVRKVIQRKEIISCIDVAEDPQYEDVESIQGMGNVSVMVSPLVFESEVYAAVYLERAEAEPPFNKEEHELIREFSELAARAFRVALERFELKRFKQEHEQGFFSKYDFGEIVGNHPKMMKVFDIIAQVADSNAPVLVKGETGTGKELIARAIHKNSSRKDSPMVTLHCGALPESLFEAELFGHRKGAFTGADRDRQGRIAQARGGTLFIDEVAEIPLTVQAKLLRFFQFGEFQRIGSDEVERIEVRIIAATHQDIPKMVREGRFRQDLYYRLKVVEVELPPLRERGGDILLIAEAFLNKYWKLSQPYALSKQALAAFQTYDYPGNVRELVHIVERVCLLAKDARIGLELLPEEVAAHFQRMSRGEARPIFLEYTNQELKSAKDKAAREAMDSVEQQFVRELMDRHGGNVARAAKAAQMQRTYLHRLVTKHELR
jgi:Nif-specific regulatory protein/two-component system response regulator HydG